MRAGEHAQWEEEWAPEPPTRLLPQLGLVVGAKRVAQRVHLGALPGRHVPDLLRMHLQQCECGRANVGKRARGGGTVRRREQQ